MLERERELEMPRLDPRIDSHVEYGGIDSSVVPRWQVYEYSADGRNIYNEMPDYVVLEPEQVLLDVGCGSGFLLRKILDKNPPGVKAIGLDIDEGLLDWARLNTHEEQYPDVSFISGHADELDLPKGSVDYIVASMVLYHVPQPEAALAEFKSVLRPGGTLLVSTSGPRNKERHRQFEQDIAEYLGVEPPPIFAEPFNRNGARFKLEQFFTVHTEVPHETDMIITAERKLDYLLSLGTMKAHMNPVPTGAEWLTAVREVVEPVIDAEIEKNGHFNDLIRRVYYVCQKND